MKTLTDFLKTVETGVDPRLVYLTSSYSNQESKALSWIGSITRRSSKNKPTCKLLERAAEIEPS